VPFASVNGLEICFHVDGDPTGEPVLLIAGLGVQLIDWPAHIVEGLVDAGCRVIRFDNRDVGLSTVIEGPSDAGAVFDAMLNGGEPDVAYGLDDMADDAVGLLDALDVQAAHVVSASLGAMVAQTMAIRHPDRVATLTSIMSTTGASDVGQPTSEAVEALLSVPPAPGRTSHIEHGVTMAKVWASPDHYDIDELRVLFGRSWDRVGGNQAEGKGRQFCALLTAAPRDAALAELQMPALVIHGTADTLIALNGGERTARCIPNAELIPIEGMGHDLPRAFGPTILKGITELIFTSARATN